MAEMIKVQMPDGTVLQFPDTMSRDAMQSAAASWWSQNGPQAAQPAPAATPAEMPMQGQDPMLPSPDTDTRSTQQYLRDAGQAEQPIVDVRGYLDRQSQPRSQRNLGLLGDIGVSALSGATRGAAELAALPDTIGSGLDFLYRKAGLMRDGPQTPSVGGAIRGAASSISGGGTEYRPQTIAGEYAQTVGEFVGGGAGARMGAAGGLLSEAAGQATEGTSVEPIARAAGGILGGVAAAPRAAQAPIRDINTPAGQRAAAANTLRSEGINVTAGQQANSPLLRRMEGTLEAPDIQPEQFTRTIMQRLGSSSEVASPSALREIQDNIVRQMDEAVQGVTIAPLQRHADVADNVASGYMANVETGQAVPRVREIATGIAARARSKSPVDLATVRTWRQDIGNLTVSSNAATRRAAQELRRLLDDMTDTALTAAGRESDIRKLAEARRAYRDFIAVRDASTRAGDAGVGILSPTQLNQSMIRVMGRENYGVGRTTPTSDFTRSAAAMMRSAPTVQAGGVRELANLPMLLSGAGGYAAGGPLGLMAGIAAPALGQSAMRSQPIQNLLINPATTFGQISRTTPGLLAQQ